MKLWMVLLALAMQALARGQAAQTTFEFHSGFWVNLHHTLYNQAFVKKLGRAPDLSALNPAELSAWSKALDYYEQNLASHDLLDFSMIQINLPLALAGNAPSLEKPKIPKPLVEILEPAAGAYRAHWWTEHDRKNRAWIEHITALVAEHEKAVKPALARAYDTPWPKDRIRVEMSYYIPGASGYTSLGPTLITVSSSSQRNEGPAALETIFHEAGHGLIQEVREEMARAEKRQGRTLAYRDLWHAIIFYTTGTVLRRQLPELEPYALKYGMWENTWPGALAVMDKDWKPFVDGKGSFRDSIGRIVADSDLH